ncbi:acyl-CoA dehydrogenase [Streptomyces sp. NPDC047065]|uniref:acyl-CoA dehydrogenase n=1 Tax=Streptomyces sp. NPDC047065 TaxID=3154606 RepID=UPI003408F31A
MTTTTGAVLDRVTEEGSGDAAVLRRAARLESLLGDPYARGNPHGLRALFDADARGEPPAATEQLLAEEGFAAEFVPLEDGGRLVRADLLARMLRPVFRRDVTLGLSAGLASWSAASVVWAAGSGEQRRAVSDLLLSGGRVAAVGRGPAAGPGPVRAEVTARPVRGGGFRLDGRSRPAFQPGRAGAYVVHAHGGGSGAPGGRSILLVDGELPGPGARMLQRVRTAGMRGALFAGVEFDDCAVGADAVVGRPGEGEPLAAHTGRVESCVLAGAVVAAVGTVLLAAVRAAAVSRSAPLLERRHALLSGVFADVLAADALVTTSLRALSLLPDGFAVQSAAVGHLLPGLFRENLQELGTVLGSRRFEEADPRYGSFAKLVRDLPVAGFGSARSTAGLAVIVPRLRGLAERSWFAGAEPPSALFRVRGDLPVPGFRPAAAGTRGEEDVLAASLVASAARLSEVRRIGGQVGRLAGLADGFVAELRELREQCARLPVSPSGGPADVAAYALGDRYALLLAAAAVLGVWEGQDGTDPFLSAPAWAVLALSRIAGRLGRPVPEVPDVCTAQVLDELVRRFRTGRSCDLYGTEPVR